MTPIPGPIILLALPLLAAGITFLVRRWAFLAAPVAVVTTAILAFLCLRLPLDRSAFVLGQEVAFGRPVVILGRNLMLDPAGQVWLAFVFALAAALSLAAWRLPQGRLFLPISLVILSLYTLIALLQTFLLATPCSSDLAALAMFLVQDELHTSVRGGQRYLVVTLLAVPFLLGASWFVDQSTLGPENAALIRPALLLAAFGFGLLLGVFPFGTWLPALAADAPPLATAFIFTTGQALALLLASVFLQGTPVTWSEPTLSDVLRLAGLVTAAAGGLMAAAQRDWGRWFGYAALSDLGYLLLAMPAGGSQGLSLTLLHLVNRAAAITLLAVALALVRQRLGTDRFARLQGTARRLPVATMGLMVGGLSLAGFPLTAGFPTHWAISRAIWGWAQPFSAATQGTAEAVPGQEWVWVLTLIGLLVSTAGPLIGLLRGLSAMLETNPRPDAVRQPALASLLVLALGALTVILGLYPQLCLEPIQRAVQALVDVGY